MKNPIAAPCFSVWIFSIKMYIENFSDKRWREGLEGLLLRLCWGPFHLRLNIKKIIIIWWWVVRKLRSEAYFHYLQCSPAQMDDRKKNLQFRQAQAYQCCRRWVGPFLGPGFASFASNAADLAKKFLSCLFLWAKVPC